ncbi:polysaccharide deacetylase family protein [uncultured Cellulomonas sp.]|uniref:polysaccharide deacetylase family protein n=1 Tax=uncultured Cellulomonas sp. TaxID=189682 RepID=UPI002607579C|nr:polysaccharide deacetylase family protein [uncultured Cellulomonas sp.]
MPDPAEQATPGPVAGADGPLVCLTFDDGPSAHRPRTLQILRELEVPAVFFDVGMRVRANPDLVRFAAAEGHQVLNHTDTHPALTSLTPVGMREEILGAGRALEDAGVEVPFRAVRPPMTAVDDVVHAVIQVLDYLEVGGTISALDWHPGTTAEAIRDSVLAQLAPGGVIVLHDGPADTGAGSATVEALPGIVAGVRESGYGFGLLDETGAVVPARYVASGQPVPELAAPVPYRPLVVPEPEPPAPWVPMP